MSLFFFSDNFYKNKDTCKAFSPQILEVYKILLVETTLELIMFCYTSSVINTIFVPCTALLYDSTAATQTLKFSTTPLNISSGIHLISLLVISSLVCGLFSQTVFQVPPSENSQAGWDLGNGMARGYRFDAKWVCLMGSYAWGIQVICSRNRVTPHFSNRTLEYLRHNFPWDRLISRKTDNPSSSYCQDLNPHDYFLRAVPERQSLGKQFTDTMVSLLCKNSIDLFFSSGVNDTDKCFTKICSQKISTIAWE